MVTLDQDLDRSWWVHIDAVVGSPTREVSAMFAVES
jgi:hypothetical protein